MKYLTGTAQSIAWEDSLIGGIALWRIGIAVSVIVSGVVAGLILSKILPYFITRSFKLFH